jgi:hypothetical protein
MCGKTLNDKSLGWLELELSLFTNTIKNKWFKLQVSYQYWIFVRKNPE